MPEKAHTGTLTSCHQNHDTVSAPRKELKSLLLKCIIYGLQKVSQSPDSSGMSSEINSLILSESIHLSGFFTQFFFFFPSWKAHTEKEFHSTHKGMTMLAGRLHECLCWSILWFIHPFCKDRNNFLFQWRWPEDGRTWKVARDAECEAGALPEIPDPAEGGSEVHKQACAPRSWKCQETRVPRLVLPSWMSLADF